MKKSKLTLKQYLAGIVCAMNNTAAWGILFFVSNYYAAYQEATGFTAEQISIIMGYTSATSMISYVFGGVIADQFRPRQALGFCCLTTSILGIGMIVFMNNFEMMRIIGMILSITCLMTSWAPSAKFLAMAGTPEETGRIYGFYGAMIGLTGFIVGIVGSAVVAASGSVLGYRVMIILYIVMLMCCLVLLPKVDPTNKNEKVIPGEKPKKEGGFKLKYVLALMKNPDQWLGWAVSLGLYIVGVAITYTTPVLTGNFMISVAVITLITTIRNNGFKFIFNPIFGGLIDRFGSPMKVQMILYGCFAAGTILFIVLPWEPQYSVIGIIALILMAVAHSSQSTASSSMLTKIGTPHEYRGTAVGVQSVVLNSPAPLLHGMVATMLATRGASEGYRTFFWVILGFIAVGFVCLVILYKRVEKREAAKAQQ